MDDMFFDDMEEVMDEIAAPKGTVSVVGAQGGFFINGLVTKIKELGLKCVFVPPTVENIEVMRNETDLYVLYLTDELELEHFVYLRDVIGEDDKSVIVIGNKEEYKEFSKIVSEKFVYKWFDRPLDMNAFLKCIEQYMDENVGGNHSKCILIVDDDVNYMHMVYDWLKDKYRVGMAASGMQAISWLANNKADLILMDYEMPVMNGPKIMEMMRSESQSDMVPVIFLTGRGDKASLMSVIDLQPADYILKTIDKDGLLAKVKYFFDKQRYK